MNQMRQSNLVGQDSLYLQPEILSTWFYTEGVCTLLDIWPPAGKAMRGIFDPAEVLRSPRQLIILHCEWTEVRSSFTVWMWCIAVVLVDSCYV